MSVFQIKCADFVIEINCACDGIKQRCEKYLTKKQAPDIVVAPSCGHFDTARKFMPGDTEEEIEFAAILCALHDKLLEKNAFVFHAAVISINGEGYAFSAQSGVGKTTHILLQKKIRGENCTIVNGDKPIITFKDGKFWASGSPWCGKEDFSENITVPIKAICFLERSEKNKAESLPSDKVIDRLFYQMSIPAKNAGLKLKCIQIADQLIKCVPFYLLKCNISEEAARLGYEEMSK